MLPAQLAPAPQDVGQALQTWRVQQQGESNLANWVQIWHQRGLVGLWAYFLAR